MSYYKFCLTYPAAEMWYWLHLARQVWNLSREKSTTTTDMYCNQSWSLKFNLYSFKTTVSWGHVKGLKISFQSREKCTKKSWLFWNEWWPRKDCWNIWEISNFITGHVPTPPTPQPEFLDSVQVLKLLMMIYADHTSFNKYFLLHYRFFFTNFICSMSQ